MSIPRVSGGEDCGEVQVLDATPEWERITRENAAAEWDATVPRWNMPRDKFIQWHLDMVRRAEQRRSRQERRAR